VTSEPQIEHRHRHWANEFRYGSNGSRLLASITAAAVSWESRCDAPAVALRLQWMQPEWPIRTLL
jgi:hypothetical protein